MDPYFNLGDYFHEEECRRKLLEYYWDQELYQVFDDIVHSCAVYEDDYIHLPYCWYIARKITADSHAAKYPVRMKSHLIDCMNQHTAMYNNLQDMIMLALDLIELASIFKERKNFYTSEKERESVAKSYLEKQIEFPITHIGKIMYMGYYVDNATVLNDTVDYLQKDEGAEKVLSEYATERKEQASMKEQLKDEVKRLQKVVAEKEAQIKNLQTQLNRLETSEEIEIENDDEADEETLYNKVRLKILYALVDAVGWNEEKQGAKIALARLAQKITGISLKQCQEYIPDRNKSTTYYNKQLREIRMQIDAAEIDISI